MKNETKNTPVIWRQKLSASKEPLQKRDTDYEILYLEQGSCRLNCGEEHAVLPAGSVLLLSGCGCTASPAGKIIPRALCCSFSEAQMQAQRTAVPKERHAMYEGALFDPERPVILSGTPTQQNRVRALLEMLENPDGEAEFPASLYLALLLHHLHQQRKTQTALRGPRNDTIEKICAYLAVNYTQKITLSDVAARFYLSPYYLSRLFRRVTGQSLVDYVNAQRVNAARTLLETTDVDIGSVAEQTGFSNAAHFRRVFKELSGVGPQQYRKSRRREN